MRSSCCSCAVARDPGLRPSRWRRARGLASWIVPGVILAAMPKCPVCVAAYVALFTGCGISLAAAGVARWLILASCVALVAYLSVKSLRDAIIRRTTRTRRSI